MRMSEIEIAPEPLETPEATIFFLFLFFFPSPPTFICTWCAWRGFEGY